MAPRDTGRTVVGSILKVATGIAAVTGAIVGIAQFFNVLDPVTILWLLSIAWIAGISYCGYRAKRGWLRIILWVIVGLSLAVGILVVYVCYFLLEKTYTN